MIENDIWLLLLKKAKKAAAFGEIPVAAAIVWNNKLISCCFNKKEKKKDITAHAEVLAIKKAARKLKRWNLGDCRLYVSLKPCGMCQEIIKQSRIEKVIYLLEKPDFKRDFSRTVFTISDSKTIVSYQQLLSDFFQNKR